MSRRAFPKAAGYHWDRAEPVVREDGKPPCRGCKGAVEKPRKVWCSDECRDHWVLRCSGQAGCRALCQARDGGVCAGCGLDTEAVRREFRRAADAAMAAYLAERLRPLAGAHHAAIRAERNRLTWSREYHRLNHEFPGDEAFAARYGARIVKALRNGSALWQADHVRELADGGDPFDPGNLQSLCICCHARKSTEASKARKPTIKGPAK